MIRDRWEITSRQEWLERRTGLLTASVIPAVFDAHPYIARSELPALVAGEGHGPTPAMRRGIIMEAAVVEALRLLHPEWTVTRATSFHTLPEHRVGATPDAWFTNGPDDQGLIQCKTVSPEVWEKWKQQVPLGYKLQLLTELMCTDQPRGILAIMVMSPSLPVFEVEVPRHPAAERRILDAAAKWWTAHDAGELAAPADDEGLAAALDDGSVIDLSGDNELSDILCERAALKAATSVAEKRLKEIDYAVKNRMGRASRGWLPGWAISFAAQHRRETIIPAKDIRVLRVKSVAEQEEEDAA